MNIRIKIIGAVLLSVCQIYAGDSNIVVQCVIGAGKDAIEFPAAFVPPLEETSMRATEEQHFASKWDLPRETVDSEGNRIFVPVTPQEFCAADGGWVVECSAEKIEGGLIRVCGVVTFTKLCLKQAVHGEQSGPVYAPGNEEILLTENKGESVVAHSSSTRFQVFARPGKQYEFEVARLGNDVPLFLTCNYEEK